MFTELMGPLVGGLLAAMIISLANRSFLPRVGTWVKRSFDVVDGHLPRILRPLEQTLLCIGVATATCFVMAYPEVPPWSVLMSSSRIDDVNSLPMLAAAAALLASLCFAAAFLRAAEKDAGDGEVYLGVRLSTFLITRSRATTTLGIPAFHVMVILLFLVPLVQPLLPTLLEFTVGDTFLTLTLKFAALAIWCSCFALVGIVLILNILSVLRSSTVGLLQPNRLKALVRSEIRMRAEEESEWIVRQPDAHQQRYLRDRTREHLDFAVAQPFDVFSVYYGLTIERFRCKSWNERSVSKYERWCRIEDNYSHSQQAVHEGIRQLVASFLAEVRLKKAQRLLNAVRDVRLDWLTAMLNGLDSSELADPVRKYLVERILQNVQAYETQVKRLRDASSHGVFESLVDEIFQCDTNNLSSMKFHLNYGEQGEVVEKVPAEVFHRLASSLLPKSSAGAASNSSGVDMAGVFEAADGLEDKQTRLFSLGTLADNLIDRTILARHESERLEVSTLAEMLPKYANDRIAHAVGAKSECNSRRNILERSAFAALNSNTTLDPASAEALLRIVHGWRLSAGLLFRLYYRNRSYTAISGVEDLKPFRDRLQLHREQDLLLDVDLPSKVVRFLAHSDVSHFVRPEGVIWLYEARKKPLTIELCEEFERRRWSDEFVNFGLTEFVQWWLTTRGTGWGSPRIDGTMAMGPRRNLAVSSHRLRAFAEKWTDMDASGSYDLGLLLEQIVPAQLDESC